LPLVIVAPAGLAITIAIPTATTTTTATAASTATAAATTAATVTTATFTATARRSTAAGAAIECGHVFGLRTLLTLAYLELDLLSFLELAEATALDRGEVHKAIFSAVVRRDETITLLSVEPLHYARRA
jgi:hypothetical protein